MRTGFLNIITEMEPHLLIDGEMELSFEEMAPPTIWRLLEHRRDLQKANDNGVLRLVDSDPETEDSDG